ncbi:MAG: ABC transporter permease [Lachnospiraceae bacterium]|nr:ABC transporter permease [Lachnospiraceae bacterium]
MKEFINNLKKFRFLFWELVKKDIKLKYRSSVLGVFWTLLEPLLTMIVLTLVFSELLGKGDDNFPVYILCGRLLYGFFSNGTKVALKSVRKHGTMIGKVYVPKYMYPLSAVVSNYIMFVISLIVLVGVMIFEKVKVTAYIFQAFVPMLLILVMTMGVGLMLSTFNVFFRDLEYLWTVGLMLIMYTCAIFYKVDKIKSASNLWIFKVNPLYSLIVMFRNAVFGRSIMASDGIVCDGYHFWYSLIFSIVVFLLGVLVFWRKQDKFILYV